MFGSHTRWHLYRGLSLPLSLLMKLYIYIKQVKYFQDIIIVDRLCGLVDFLAANPEVPGTIPGATGFSE
jgi:hypothetical protein